MGPVADLLFPPLFVQATPTCIGPGWQPPLDKELRSVNSQPIPEQVGEASLKTGGLWRSNNGPFVQNSFLSARKGEMKE